MNGDGWAIVALFLYLGWGGAAFGVRAVIQRRRTGDAGFRGISGTPATAAWWAGVAFVLAVLGGLAAPVAALLGLAELPGGDATLVRGSGLVVAVAGMALTLLAQTAMGNSWRVGVAEDERTELVMGGLFAYVRNPVFSAMLLTALGLALLVANVVAVVALVLLVVAVRAQVQIVEEPYLSVMHGASYTAYARRVGRFVPGVGRLR